MREKLTSRLGFILLSAGVAVGLGNVWRFPSVVGQNGGGWFVALHLVFLALIGLPILFMEFGTGRAAKRSIARLHETLTPRRRLWRLHGIAGFLGSIVLLMFCTTLTGWMFIYLVRMANGAFVGLDAAAVSAAFDGLRSDPRSMVTAMLAVTAVTTLVGMCGLQKGAVRVAMWLMPCLLVMIAALAVHSIRLDARLNDFAGLKFYLIPDYPREEAIGPIPVLIEAMNQSFCTLSIGIGAMSVFGSYIGQERKVFGGALAVWLIATFVALAVGAVVVPACFACGVDLKQGTGLIFATLPSLFNSLPSGQFWGTLFFAFLSGASLMAVIAVFENILACLMDYFGWSRRRAGLVAGVALAVLALPCILGFGVWRGFHPFGANSSVLDLEDFLVSSLFLPLGSMAFACYCCHHYGWSWGKLRLEANTGRGLRFPTGPVRVYCTYVLPILIFVIFFLGLLDKFVK